MLETLTLWLQKFDIEIERVIQLAEALGLIAAISIAIHLVLHRGVLLWLKRHTHHEQSVWRNALFKEHLFSRVALLIQGVVIAVQTQLWLSPNTFAYDVLHTLTSLWIVVFGMLATYSVLNVLELLISRTQVVKTCRHAAFCKASS